MSRPWPDRRVASAARERALAAARGLERRVDGVWQERRVDGAWQDLRVDLSPAARRANRARHKPTTWPMRERALALWMHGAAAHLWALRLFEVVSRIGDGWIWYATIVLLPWFDHHSGASAAVRMVAVGSIDLVLYKIIKRIIARPRPYRACTQFRPCVKPLDEFSFPSGHTMHSVAFSVILTVYHPHLAPLVWPFTALLATSRVVLGLHYPSDVVVGAALGAVTAWISFNVM